MRTKQTCRKSTGGAAPRLPTLASVSSIRRSARLARGIVQVPPAEDTSTLSVACLSAPKTSVQANKPKEVATNEKETNAAIKQASGGAPAVPKDKVAAAASKIQSTTLPKRKTTAK
jgi:hypothetical protein